MTPDEYYKQFWKPVTEKLVKKEQEKRYIVDSLFHIKCALVFMFTVSVAQGFLIIYLLTH